METAARSATVERQDCGGALVYGNHPTDYQKLRRHQSRDSGATVQEPVSEDRLVTRSPQLNSLKSCNL